MLTIRFNRRGKKNKAYFRVVLQEKIVAPNGKHVEILGSYDPHLKRDSLKKERIKYWLDQGAQTSDSVYNFFITKGIIQGKKRKLKLPEKEATVSPEEEKKSSVAEIEDKKAAPPTSLGNNEETEKSVLTKEEIPPKPKKEKKEEKLSQEKLVSDEPVDKEESAN